MTYFEYISIAISLVFAFAITEILRALVPAVSTGRRYYPHIMWLLATFVLIIYAWVSLWRVTSEGIEWTGPVFLYSFINPAITTVMTRLLTSPAPESVASFRDHFEKIRRPFYAVLLAFMVNGICYAWVVGATEFPELGPPQYGAMAGVVIGLAGIIFRNVTLHYAMSTLTVVVLLGLMSIIPAYT